MCIRDRLFILTDKGSIFFDHPYIRSIARLLLIFLSFLSLGFLLLFESSIVSDPSSSSSNETEPRSSRDLVLGVGTFLFEAGV